jgi:Flp pilus assembly protein TadD/ferredoxin
MSLPVIQSKTQIRRSGTTKWRAGVLIAVHLAIAAHIAHWLVSGRTLTPVEPSEAAAWARSGVVNTGLIFFLAAIALTAVFGRFFCGWGCHLVALQDLSRSLLAKFGRRPKPLRSRLLRWVPAAAFFYAFVWPAVVRWRVGGSLAHLETELTTAEFWATFPGWTIGILTFLICGVVAVYFLGAKGFCTFACPYGAVFGGAERLSPLRVRVTDACEGCGHCTATCTSNVRVHEEVRDFGMVVDSGCMKCLDCVSVCPNGALYYGSGPLPMITRSRSAGRTMNKYPLSWLEETVVAVSFVAGFWTFRGLYGQVPLLMALGIAAVLSYLTLLTCQLVTRSNLALKSWQLKRGGVMQRAGLGFLIVMTALSGFWLHSGVVRYHIARGDRTAGITARWQGAAFDLAARRPSLPAGDRKALEEGLGAYAAARRIGLFDTLGAAPLMASMEFVLGDDEAAIGHARQAIAKDELSGRMHQLLGRLAFDRGELADAVASFERAVVADPYDPRPHTSLGIALAQTGELSRARKVFQAAIEDFGASSGLEYNLGLAEAYAGRLDAAATHFARALAVEPALLPARENLAGTLAVLGRFGESAEHYEQAVGQAPRDPVTRVLYAQVLLELGRVEEANRQLDVALEVSPGMSEALNLRDEASRRVERSVPLAIER